MLPQVIVATRKSYITGVSHEYANILFTQNGPPNPVYRHNAKCVASAVILWPGVVASFARSVLPSFPNNSTYEAILTFQIAPILCGNHTCMTTNSGPELQHTETKVKKPRLICHQTPGQKKMVTPPQRISYNLQILRLILALEKAYLAFEG